MFYKVLQIIIFSSEHAMTIIRHFPTDIVVAVRYICYLGTFISCFCQRVVVHVVMALCLFSAYGGSSV